VRKIKKIYSAVFDQIRPTTFSCMLATLKNCDITKIKKKRLGIMMKNSQKPNFIPIGPVGSEL